MVCELRGVRADVQFMKRMRGARVWLLKIRHTSKFISRICKFYQISHRWTQDWTGSNVVINSIVAEVRPEKHWLLLLSSHHHHSRRLKTRKWCDKLLFTLLQAHSQNNPGSTILSSSSFNVQYMEYIYQWQWPASFMNSLLHDIFFVSSDLGWTMDRYDFCRCLKNH